MQQQLQQLQQQQLQQQHNITDVCIPAAAYNISKTLSATAAATAAYHKDTGNTYTDSYRF